MVSHFMENWTTQLRKGFLEFCILNVLDEDRLYGYDVVRRLRTVESLMIGEGTIYPILNRLRNERLLEAAVEESPQGPPRKYYRLTTLGREQLGEMNEHWKTLTSGVERLRKQRRT